MLLTKLLAARRLAPVMGWPLVALACAGCGGDRATVTGAITRLDGTPLPGATIIARSAATGKAARDQTDQQGRFALGTVESGDGVPPGDYDVVILEDRGDPENPRPKTIAAKYGSAANSGIKFTVEPGEDAVLDLKVDARAAPGKR